MIALIVVCAAGGIYFYAVYDPEHSGSFFPKCGFYVLTGYKCPGCGTQRALHHFLHGDFLGAFKQNALAFLAVPYVILLALAHHSSRFNEKYPRTASALKSYLSTLMAVAAVFVFWIARNILDF
ncbi:MAG: DUF2752 domain-containing protein [Bacteroidales bacterium]|nr:DUF2752 domain-containing protein [Bacteroidales bacterium]